jgi:Mg/Co/Ni transporter MgtE
MAITHNHCNADFDDLIAQHVELSFFVPLIMGHGGNTGSQTTCAVIRLVDVWTLTFLHNIFIPESSILTGVDA